ncbi:endothelin-converting enzyme 1 [Fistulina hepatica ATCC 64428]|uniref:Endothelin-converting enzyme 1 n=1 Tax=Fistulina hepatica ATCC 64428 TaxID=1128425 RepID=A0A0D7A8G6_9AGAR|nr:endothelin-converting enzyme 1 [Fistulina hepatica ATCC 64428]
MPSSWEDTSPLLRDPEIASEAPREPPADTSLKGRVNGLLDNVNDILAEPLTALTKVLLVVCLVFLLLSSIFIGLFAGAKYKLDEFEHTQPDPSCNSTTVVSTSTQIDTSTATSTSTTTIFPPPPPPTHIPEPVCLTPQCVLLAASILSAIDTTQDPCENFYGFAANGWLQAHPLPADKGIFGVFNELSKENGQLIRNILESDSLDLLAAQPLGNVPILGMDNGQLVMQKSSTADADKIVLDKLRTLYASCMDEEGMAARGTAPLMHIINHLRALYRQGGRADVAADTTKKPHGGLTAALAFLHSRGIQALFDASMEGDVGTDPNAMVLWLSQGDFGLPAKEYFGEDDVREVYTSTVERLLKVAYDETEKTKEQAKASSSLPAEEPRTSADANAWPPWPWPPWGDDEPDKEPPMNSSERARKMAPKVVDFEWRMSNASLDLDVLLQDPIATYNPVPLSNVTETLTQVNFPEFFATFAPRAFPERVVLTYPAYLRSLSKILDSTDEEVVEMHLVARAALEFSPLLSMETEAWQAQRALVELLSGIKKGVVGDRSEYCVKQVEETMGFAAGRYFVQEAFAGVSREKGTKVITNIVAAFQASLDALDWMDDESAAAARRKAAALRVKVGYPLSPDTRNPASLAAYYGTVDVRKDRFFENVLGARANDAFKQWLQVGKRRDPEAWEMYPSMVNASVNAYYNPPANEIVFPAGILQPPFFSKDWPGYLTYGAFGHVASHELTHAFDSAGRLYNPEGKLEQWWTNETSAGFQVKQDCIVTQYEGYTVDDGKGGKVHVNGNLTSGENIGDTGLIQAYRAWKAQYDESYAAGNEYLLPGLDYTRDQLFFMSFGRIWAQSIKPAAAVQRVRTDPHAPNQYRVDGTVYNIPEFAEAFKCSDKAKLNPPSEHRCLFWS